MRQLPTCNHLLAAARDRTAQDRRGALIRIFLGAERVSSPWPGCKAARRRGRDVSGRPECVAHLPNRDGPECQAEIFRVPKFRLQLSCRAQVHFLARSCIQTRLRPSERASAGARRGEKVLECEAITGKFKQISRGEIWPADPRGGEIVVS